MIELCDFGYGVLRVDVGRISIVEKVSENGDYAGLSWACQFDFGLLEFMRRLRKFLQEKT